MTGRPWAGAFKDEDGHVLMATLVADRRRTLPLAAVRGIQVPLWQAVILSRLLVLVAGAAGAVFLRPVPGWQYFDSQRLSTSLGAVGNVLAAAAVRWDAISYVTLAKHGYTSAISTVRFPLYPMLTGALAPVVHSAVLAGVLISLAAFGTALLLIHRLASEHLGRRVADTAVLILAFAPWSFVFSADYTTSLQLMWAAATFYLAERGRFVPACLVAAAAAVTHVDGILLVAPLAVIHWKQSGRSFDPRRLWSPKLLGLLLPPLALGGFFVYLHARGFGWLAPVTHQNLAVAGRRLIGPPATVFYALKDVVVGLREQLGGTAPPTGGLPLGTQNCIYLVVFVIDRKSVV